MVIKTSIKRLIKCNDVENLDEYFEQIEKKLNKNKKIPKTESRITLDDVKKYVQDHHNGDCLSKKYVRNNFFMVFICKNKHIFYANFQGVRERTWCAHPDCDGTKLQELKSLAEKNGGKCLSTEYIKSTTKHLFECANRHQWYAVSNSITSQGTWCPYPECGGTKKYTIEEVKEFAKSRGGECLSDTYIKVSEYLEFKCEFGHKWKATYASIKDHWCHECSPHISMGERCARAIVNIMFNEEFVSCRPEWLKNPDTNRNLEIDIYCEKIKLGFEYNGAQHYIFIEQFHKTLDKFKELQKRDQLKLNKCIENGIKLISIPYTVKIRNLQQFIIEACEKNDIVIPNKNKININELKIFSNYQTEKYEKLINIVELKKGECLSDTYIPESLMIFKCEKDHVWETDPINIINGSWCDKCYRESQKDYTIESINEIIKDYNCVCISNEYINNLTHLDWKCNKCNYTWKCDLSSIFKKIKRGVDVCSNCNEVDKLNEIYESIIKTSAEYNCICLSTEYKNQNTLMDFKCKSCNAEWQCSYSNFKNRLDAKRKRALCLECKYDN